MWRDPLPQRDPNFRYDTVVLVFLAGVLVFSSPFVAWWGRDGAAWYLPYLLWLALIALIALALHGFEVEATDDADAPPPDDPAS